MGPLSKKPKLDQTAELISSWSDSSSEDELEQFLGTTSEAPEGDDWLELHVKEFFHNPVDVGEPLNNNLDKAVNSALQAKSKTDKCYKKNKKGLKILKICKCQ